MNLNKEPSFRTDIKMTDEVHIFSYFGVLILDE